jgi:uncharacterized protein with FMN-binding domain
VSSFVRRVAATFAGTVVALGLLLEAKTGAGPPRNALAVGLRTRPVATAPPGQGPTTTEAPPPPPTTVAGVPTTAAAVPSTQATATTTTTHAVARPTTTSTAATTTSAGGSPTTRPAPPSTLPTTTTRPPTTTTTAPAVTTRVVDGPAVDVGYGTVQVAVTLQGKRITDVTALQLPSDRSRSRSISQYAAPILRSEALQAQSAQINTVSGASYTSAGYAESLQRALDQAGQ